jgi:hypothetical protein
MCEQFQYGYTIKHEFGHRLLLSFYPLHLCVPDVPAVGRFACMRGAVHRTKLSFVECSRFMTLVGTAGARGGLSRPFKRRVAVEA